jgi:hypothetical protein
VSSLPHRAVAGVVCALFGCVHVLPAPPVPERVMPDVSAAPIAPGNGQVLLDTVNDPARVEEAAGRVEETDARGRPISGELYRPVCPSTPCAANLPFGSHELRFSSLTDSAAGGIANITSGANPTAYRYAMGRYDSRGMVGGLVTLGLGVAAAIAGIGLEFTGGATNAVTGQPDSPGLQTAGTVVVIGGAALFALGIVLLVADGPESQEGRGVQWELQR